MQQVERIRKHVFRVGQAEFALLAGVTQGTVSKWESGKLTPSHENLMAIRTAAAERGLMWNDAWFFEAPSVPPLTAAGAAHP